MKTMSRSELRHVVAIVFVGVLALRVLGYGGWGAWPQLLTGFAVVVAASLAAPDAFGWRHDSRARRR